MQEFFAGFSAQTDSRTARLRHAAVCGLGGAFMGRRLPPVPPPKGEKGRLLQAVLVGLDHLLDHLAANGAGLAGSEITVVAVLKVDANLP